MVDATIHTDPRTIHLKFRKPDSSRRSGTVQFGQPALDKEPVFFFDDDAPGNSRLSAGWSFVGTPEPVLSGKKSIRRRQRTHPGGGGSISLPARSNRSRRGVFRMEVYLDPKNPPKQIMIQFHNGNWEHRAFWGQI